MCKIYILGLSVLRAFCEMGACIFVVWYFWFIYHYLSNRSGRCLKTDSVGQPRQNTEPHGLTMYRNEALKSHTPSGLWAMSISTGWKQRSSQTGVE
jgi:hypothetical protein